MKISSSNRKLGCSSRSWTLGILQAKLGAWTQDLSVKCSETFPSTYIYSDRKAGTCGNLSRIAPSGYTLSEPLI